jgi:hypothetical protein
MTINHTDAQEIRLPWAGRPIRLEHAEQELSHLWRMSADNVRTAQNINVRTSVLNFIICASDLESAKQAHATMRDLSSTHIARVLLLILDSSQETPTNVSSWITLRSFTIISDIMRHTFEQITVVMSGVAVPSAATIVHQLLKPDLPVYLWWLNDPPHDRVLFENMVSLSNRVIVDSNTFLHSEQSVIDLSAMQTSINCALSDLNWARITQWRELIAQFFDNAEYQPYLTGVQTIEIEHAVAPSAESGSTEQAAVSTSPTPALLLAAWLKTRLGWNLSSRHVDNEYNPAQGIYTWHVAGPTGLLATRPSGTTTTDKAEYTTSGVLSIRPRRQSNLSPGSICMVRLFSKLDENQNATFTINCDDDQKHVLTSVESSGMSRPQRVVSLAATEKESTLLHDELEIMGHDYPYEEALHEVAELLKEQ